MGRLFELIGACILVAVMGSLMAQGRIVPAGWTPLLLMVTALLPTIVCRRNLRSLGLQWGAARRDVLHTLVLVILGLVVVGGILVLCRSLGITWPMAFGGHRQDWSLSIVYQLTHVAFPEELFFRGYVQTGLLYLLQRNGALKKPKAAFLAVVAAAAIFALCHAVILLNPGTLLTFFPGLVMGWLFLRTKSLLSPTLFHGLANIGYDLLGLWV